ncbi:hypothetical protein KCP76_11720 [Salmonella enterica subsp. enterica serovar Weltevreden]|nr:hypothetical protein KCP76_11720 [Salmonella enterica subsp. enterica serovar Weltevreden]
MKPRALPTCTYRVNLARISRCSNAMGHVIIEENLYDKAFCRQPYQVLKSTMQDCRRLYAGVRRRSLA